MGFREMSAWVMAALLIGLGVFYANAVIGTTQALDAVPAPSIPLLVVTTVLLVAGAIVGHVVAAALSPNDANAPEDERDRLVLWRAGNLSGLVLGAGVFGGLWHFMFRGDGNLLFHILIGSLIVAQISEYIFQIIYYRSGL
jgi:hypothetical protein